MKRHLVTLALLIAIGAGWYGWRTYALSERRAATEQRQGSGAGSAAAPPAHVRRISVQDREQLVRQLAAARATRASHAAAAAAAGGGGGGGATSGERPALPADDDHTHDLDRVSAPVMTALQESIPFLAACYKEHAPGQTTAVAQMTLTNDPDIGAVIDADQVRDEQQQPLPPALEDCLRGTLQTLQLPPLAAGDSIKLQYSFRMGSDDAK